MSDHTNQGSGSPNGRARIHSSPEAGARAQAQGEALQPDAVQVGGIGLIPLTRFTPVAFPAADAHHPTLFPPGSTIPRAAGAVTTQNTALLSTNVQQPHNNLTRSSAASIVAVPPSSSTPIIPRSAAEVTTSQPHRPTGARHDRNSLQYATIGDLEVIDGFGHVRRRLPLPHFDPLPDLLGPFATTTAPEPMNSGPVNREAVTAPDSDHTALPGRWPFNPANTNMYIMPGTNVVMADARQHDPAPFETVHPDWLEEPWLPLRNHNIPPELPQAVEVVGSRFPLEPQPHGSRALHGPASAAVVHAQEEAPLRTPLNPIQELSGTAAISQGVGQSGHVHGQFLDIGAGAPAAAVFGSVGGLPGSPPNPLRELRVDLRAGYNMQGDLVEGPTFEQQGQRQERISMAPGESQEHSSSGHLAHPYDHRPENVTFHHGTGDVRPYPPSQPPDLLGPGPLAGQQPAERSSWHGHNIGMLNVEAQNRARLRQLQDLISAEVHTHDYLLRTIVAAHPHWHDQPYEVRHRQQETIWLNQVGTFRRSFMELHNVDSHALTAANDRFTGHPMARMRQLIEVQMRTANNLPQHELPFEQETRLRRLVLEAQLLTLQAWSAAWRTRLPPGQPEQAGTVRTMDQDEGGIAGDASSQEMERIVSFSEYMNS